MKEKDYYSIGEISDLFGLNIRTLRYYDQIELLKPAYIDQQSHYRFYHVNQFETINSIIYLRTLNMPIDKIKEFLNHKDTDVLLRVLQEQKDEILKRKKELEICERKINNRILQLHDALNEPLNKIKLCMIEERKAIVLHQEYDKKDNIEKYIRKLSSKYNIPKLIFLGKVAFLIHQNNILKKQYDRFNSTIVILEKEDEYQGDYVTLPQGLYVKIHYCGIHSDASIYYEKILKYIQTHQLQIIGDAIELSLIDYCNTLDKDKYVMELQIPVKKV